MSGFLRAAAVLGSASVLGILTSIGRAKLLAIEVGPAGVATLAQFSDIVALLVALLLFGTEHGIIALTADAYAGGDPAALVATRRVIRRSILLPGLAVIAVLAATAPWWVATAANSPIAPWLAVVLIAAVATSSSRQIWRCLLQGARLFGLLARAQAATSVLALAVLVPLVLLWGLDGAILSIAAELIVGLIVTAFMIRSLAPPQPKAAPTTGLDDRATLKLLMNFGGATVIAAVVGRLMTLWIRRRTIEHIGLDGTGLFQVAYGICQQYVAIVLGAMGAYALPTYRRLMSDRPALIGEMNSTLRGTLLFIVPALIGLMLFRDILIRLLYSEAFAGASDMLQIQLVGDLFKGFSWSIGLIMLASGRMWWHVLADVSFWLIAVVTMEAIALSSPHVAPSLGLTIGHVCLAVISYSVARRAVGFTLGARNRRLCGASVLAVAAAFIGASVGGWVSVVASTAALVVWLRLAVERSELRGLLVWLTPRARSVLAPLGLGGALDAIVGRLTTLLADPAAHDDAGEP